jgi:hypothetical protein
VKCKGTKRSNTIEQANPDEIRALTEIALNIINGNFELTPETVEKLKKHKEHIRNLAKRTLSHKKKKLFLVQKGGFLPFLITPVLSALGALAGRAIGNQLGL